MGYTHIYTGNGKGKTTCSLGLALRACGCGKKVYIGQYLKKGDYSEIKAIENFLPNITVEQFGTGEFVMGKPSEADLQGAIKACNTIKEKITSGEYDLVILDEINCAVDLGLVSEEFQLNIIDIMHEKTELVMTGRGAKPSIIEKADLVSEIKEVKHYYNDGVDARKGIEF